MHCRNISTQYHLIQECSIMTDMVSIVVPVYNEAFKGIRYHGGCSGDY